MNYIQYFSKELAKIPGMELSVADSILEKDFSRQCRLDKIPITLKDYYLLLGNHEINHEYNRLIPPAQLVLSDGYLIFMEENQYICYWAVKESDLSASDPEVIRIDNILEDERNGTGHLEFISTQKPFSEFIIEMVRLIHQELQDDSEVSSSPQPQVSFPEVKKTKNVRKELPKYFIAFPWPPADDLFDFYVVRNTPVTVIFGVLPEKNGTSLDFVPALPANLDKDKDLIIIECMKVLKDSKTSFPGRVKASSRRARKIENIRRGLPAYFIAFPWPPADDLFDSYVIRNTPVPVILGALREKPGTSLDFVPDVPNGLRKEKDLVITECMKILNEYYEHKSK